MTEGGTDKNRDSQFRYINDLAKEFIRRGDPVVSVDVKKKERIGDFKNPWRGWRPKGCPHKVNVYPIFGNSRFCFLKKDLIKNKNKMIKFD